MRFLSLRALIALAAFAVGAFPAPSWGEGTGELVHVRTMLQTGYDTPIRFDGYRHGVGMGAGVEIERSPAASVVLSVHWRRIWGPSYALSSSPAIGQAPPPTEKAQFVHQWSLGLRGYLRPRAVWRPYGELGVGARFAERDSRGTVVTPRVGMAWARYQGPGVFLDGGLELLSRDFTRSVIAPVRVAVTFP